MKTSFVGLSRRRRTLWVLVFIVGLSACAGRGVKLDNDALYYRLGARKELGKIITDTVDAWSVDTRILSSVALKDKLQGTDTTVLKRQMFSFFCWATEGPCSNPKDELQNTFQGLKLTNLEWYFLMEGFVASLAKHSVPLKEQNEILEIVYGLQPKVVGK